MWVLWLVSWLVASGWSSPTLKRAAILRQLPDRVITALGGVLLFAPLGRDGIAPVRLWNLDAAVAWSLTLVVALGVAFAWWARLHLGRLWSGTVTQKEGHHIVDTGAYAIVRHPIYTGLLLSAFATAALEATWSGFAYVAFVTDVYSRRIVGWNVAATLKADILPLQALDMAAWQAGGRLDGLVHHADHGSNYLAMVYTDRIAELGATPSTGTVGDSYDNALAEAVNGLYKTELIRRRGPWRTVEQVELATCEYVWWWNNQRLHGELGMHTPAEVEAAYAHLVQPRLATASPGNH